MHNGNGSNIRRYLLKKNVSRRSSWFSREVRQLPTAVLPRSIRPRRRARIQRGIKTTIQSETALPVIGFTKTTDHRESRETFENAFSPSAVTRIPAATQKGYSNRGAARNDTGNEFSRRSCVSDRNEPPTGYSFVFGTLIPRSAVSSRPTRVRSQPSIKSKSQTPWHGILVVSVGGVRSTISKATFDGRQTEIDFTNKPGGGTRSSESLGNHFKNPFWHNLRAKVHFIV